jgi:hypothetical protein
MATRMLELIVQPMAIVTKGLLIANDRKKAVVQSNPVRRASMAGVTPI